MSRPILSFPEGSIEVSVWQGEYEGKPSYSFSISKGKKKKDGSWENQTIFLNRTDLKDVISAINALLSASIKKRGESKMKAKSAPPQAPQNEYDNAVQGAVGVPDDSDIPF